MLWPKELAAQIALVRDAISRTGWKPVDGVKALAKHFAGRLGVTRLALGSDNVK